MNLDKNNFCPNWQPLDHIEEIHFLASLGLDEGQIAAHYNLPPSTIRYWRTEEPKVDEAMTRGLASSIYAAADQLNRLVNSGDFKAIRFFLERKGGWSSTVNVRNTISLPSADSFHIDEILPNEIT